MSNVRRIIGLLAVLAAIRTAAPAFATTTDFFVFKAAVTLPATMIVERMGATDLFITRKLTANDLVNLALGRPLGTKVDKKTEILAVAVTFLEDAQESKLIVFDPSQNGVAQEKAVVGHVTSLDARKGSKSNGESGVGAGSFDFDATAIGDFAHNGLLASTLEGGGTAGGPFGSDFVAKGSGKVTVTGHVKFTFTEDGVTSVFDGIVTQGTAKASGARIGTFTE